jgi:tetratricopeptide (TPR) repeat protein
MLPSTMRRSPAWLVVALCASGAAAASARVALEPAASALGTIQNPAWLPRGDQLRAVSLGQRLLLSDLYWLKLVQYVGENYLGQGQRWEALYPLADLVTDLDPRHAYAYQIAGSNLGGLAHRYDEAERILKKGMQALPDRWTFYFVMATNKFLYEGDFEAAARYARRAAEVGHRPYLALLAANLSLVAGSEQEEQAAEQFLVESLRQVDTPELRNELQQRLVKVRTFALLGRLERARDQLTAAQGRRPASLAELARAAGLDPAPADPAGGRIEYDPGTGELQSSVLGPRKPLRVTP